MEKTIRCVECDKLFVGDFDEHCETTEHQINTKTNYVLRGMEDVDINLETLTKTIKSRKANSQHGKLILKLGEHL